MQTPNYYFAIEPHLIAPCIHWLPRAVAKILLPFTIRNILTSDLRNNTEAIFNEVRLLKAKEVKELFPDAVIVFERFLRMPKSIIAV